MSDETHMNRRDLLKMGGLCAITLPTITKIGCVDNDELLASEAAYGGFAIRTDGSGKSAIAVDDATYQRFHARDAIFSRIIWDQPFADKIANTKRAFAKGDPGYSHLDAALNSGAIFCSVYNGTNSPMMGMHGGLLDFDSPYMSSPTHPSFEGRWDYSVMSPEQVSEVVKKAALFYGASVVGIAPLDTRWIYSGYYDILGGKEAPITITKVKEVALPEGQVSPQQAAQLIRAKLEERDDEDIKKLVVEVLETTDPALLPANAPPVGIVKMLPAKDFRAKLSVFTAMPTPVLRILMGKLGMDYQISMIDPGESGRPRYLDDGTFAIPETMKTVIVLAFEMDYDCFEATPTNLGDAATMDGYSKMAITAGSLAVFLRALGYNAIPCGNNTGISVPMAIQAGLGEAGRHGLLITPKYGSRIRLAKVITDLPVAYDKPIRFGVKEFCNVCKKCARQCPTQAISYGPPSAKAQTVSNNPGVLKWAVDPEKCYAGWAANGSGCGVCIRVCPFNKPEGWLHDATRVLIGAKSGTLDSLLVKLDDASGFGTPEPKFDFWQSKHFIHIKD